MLAVHHVRSPETPPLTPSGAERVVTGLHEDTDYYLAWGGPHPADRLYIDDAAVPADHEGRHAWRPEFYAGRVRAELARANGTCERFWLDVGPSKSKSGHVSFMEMVQEIRASDARLLLGDTAATLLFGRHGHEGLFSDDVLLSRIQAYLPTFLDAVRVLMRALHQQLSMRTQLLPLSRVRRISTSALRDRRVAAFAGGMLSGVADYSDIHLRARAPIQTYDTPANQALVALMRRLQGELGRLMVLVDSGSLGIDRDGQALRRTRRLTLLRTLDDQLRRLLAASPFDQVRRSGVTAAGLTQIAAHPGYSRAYTLGCHALNTSLQGDDQSDLLHAAPSWGIYETWCYLRTVQAFAAATGAPAEHLAAGSRPVSSKLAHRCQLPGSVTIDFLFQATFPSGAPAGGRTGYSISRERIPDILVIRREADQVSCLVLDAKWRSGRAYVLDAMASAHIYHDSLRLEAQRPERAILLLPGEAAVPALEETEFLDLHGVGAISEFRPDDGGVDVVLGLLTSYAAGTTSS